MYVMIVIPHSIYGSRDIGSASAKNDILSIDYLNIAIEFISSPLLWIHTVPDTYGLLQSC